MNNESIVIQVMKDDIDKVIQLYGLNKMEIFLKSHAVPRLNEVLIKIGKKYFCWILKKSTSTIFLLRPSNGYLGCI